jgi:redox-sensitive bicupin YhaK (pirin superfamily)
MSTKPIEVIVPPREPHYVGDGFRVHNFIPSAYRLDMERMSPFIMLDYNSRFYFPPSEKPLGVGVHPHRGFETVTIAYKGRVAHHDSSGGGGVIGEGDVQWMTAASGVLHKEYHEETFSKEGGEFQMVQLWVNLPAKWKMSQPKYQAIANKEMGVFELQNNGGIIEVVAGQYNGVQGPADTFTPISMLNVKLNQNGEATFDFPPHYNTALLVVEGEIQVNGDSVVPVDHFVLFENLGEQFKIKGIQESTVLVLSGEPINEPIAAHGPFVMNTRQELYEAFQDFQNGKFGYLED